MLVDINKDLELPQYELSLRKPTGEEIAILSTAYNKIYKPKFAGIDEFEFKIPFYIMDNHRKIKNPHFDLVKGDYYIVINNTHWFLIDIAQKVTEKDGNKYKLVHCYSREYELTRKKIRGYKADSRLIYDSNNTIDESGYYLGIMNYIESLTSWKVDYVNVDLLSKYRGFDMAEGTIMQFLVEIQKKFNCLMQFNTENKLINIYKIDELGQNKGLYISDENYIKSLTENINYDEIKTRLYLYGKDNISINSINPTGTSYIENLSFFKTTEYMSQSLIDALNNYETLVESKSGDFQNYLTQLDDLNSQLSTKESELAQLETELQIIQDNIDIAIENGDDLTTLNQQKSNKEAEIVAKEQEISDLEGQINTIYTDINNLRDTLKMENNFIQEQLEELDPFIRDEVYSDTNYTEDNIEELYEEGQRILARISQPPIELQIDVVDFLNLIECQHHWDKLVLGDLINIVHSNFGVDLEVRLVSYTHDYDNNSLTLEFSNRNRIDDPYHYLADLLNQVTTTSSQVDFNKFKWGRYEEEDRTVLMNFINNELDVSKNKIINAANQKPIIDEHGIWLLKKLEDGTISPEQIRMINNVIALTTDNWQTAKWALSPSGINAEIIRGILGEFAQVRANKIIVGDGGEKITDDLIDSASYWNSIENSLQNQIDQKINTYYQTTMPHQEHINVPDNEEYNKLVGNLWYDSDSSSKKTYRYTKKTNGNNYDYIWEELEIPKDIFDTIDGKRTVYTIQPSSYKARDLLIPNETFTVDTKIFNAQEIYIATADNTNFDENDWEKAVKYTDDTKANEVDANAVKKGVSYNNVTITTENGLVATRNDNMIKTILNATDGFKIQRKDGENWIDQIVADADGKLSLNDLLFLMHQGEAQLTFKNPSTGEEVVKKLARINEDGDIILQDGFFNGKTTDAFWLTWILGGD